MSVIAAHLSEVKAVTIVLNDGADGVTMSLNEDAGRLCLGVPHHVGQGFLYNPVQRRFNSRWKPLVIQTLDGEINMQWMETLAIRNMAFQSSGQTQIVEHTGTQLQGQRVDFLQCVCCNHP